MWILRYRWTAEEFDQESQLYFHRSRYYSPSQMRFIQEDASGFAAGPNLYAYGDGDPTTGRDPDGMSKEMDLQVTPPHPLMDCMGTTRGCGYNATEDWRILDDARELGGDFFEQMDYQFAKQEGEERASTGVSGSADRAKITVDAKSDSRYVAPDWVEVPTFKLVFEDRDPFRFGDLHHFTLIHAKFQRLPGRVVDRGDYVLAYYRLVSWDELIPGTPGEGLDYLNRIRIRSTLIEVSPGNFSGGFQQWGRAGGKFRRR